MPVIMKPRRALLLYATMTKNTEKIANWFRETFLHYGWEVTYLRIAANTDWVGLQDQLYFEDYDLVCLGSPIVGGSPLQAVIKAFSFRRRRRLGKRGPKQSGQQEGRCGRASQKTGGGQLAPSPRSRPRYAGPHPHPSLGRGVHHLRRRFLWL